MSRLIGYNDIDWADGVRERTPGEVWRLRTCIGNCSFLPQPTEMTYLRLKWHTLYLGSIVYTAWYKHLYFYISLSLQLSFFTLTNL